MRFLPKFKIFTLTNNYNPAALGDCIYVGVYCGIYTGIYYLVYLKPI